METEKKGNDLLMKYGFLYQLKPKQLEVINSIINKRDTYAVLPTGYGKSVCYFLPPILLDNMYPLQKHTSLVVSPLKSLIDDQVKTLRQHGIEAYGIHEGLDKNNIEDIKKGTATVLLSSPESIISTRWMRVLENIYSSKLCMVAYDEAHCISEWGLDFRVDYQKVGILQSILDCPVLSLTATSTKDIKSDISKILGFREVHVISSLPDRPNIFVHIKTSSEKYEEELCWIKNELLERGRDCTKIIIYVNSISFCERIFIWLFSSLKQSAYDGKDTSDIHKRLIEMYHANSDPESKERIMTDFKQTNGILRLVVATVAVGMGIDIPDISLVVVWGLPSSMLQMWQEAGRCGRDGSKAIFLCYAYPRSKVVPCDKCRKSGKRNCLCPQKLYLKNATITQDCQRVYCLEYFCLDTINSADMDLLKSEHMCDKLCMEKCQCKFCTCCINCLVKCECPKRIQSSNICEFVNCYLDKNLTNK